MYDENENSTLYSNSLGKPIKSFTGSRISQKIVEDKVNSLDNELASYLATLEEIDAKWKEIKSNRELTTTEMRKYSELITVHKQLEEFSKTKNKDAEDLINLTQDYAKVVLDSEKKILEAKQKAGKMTEEQLEQELERYGDLKDVLRQIIKESKDLGAHIDNAENKTKHLKETINTYRERFRDIAAISGLDKVKEQLMGGSEGSLMDVRNKVASQFGFSSRNEWNSFKNALIGNTMSINANLGKVAFGFGEVKRYMSELSALGIYDTKMAEAQLQAVLEGNKILGISTETQAQILKIGRRTGNTELLQEVNDTIATLLNAQIGLSKEQLTAMTQQAAGPADLLTYFGNDKAMTQLLEGQALIEKKYGYGASNSAMNILSDLMTNGYNSNAYTLLGTGANAIIDEARNGDAGKALQMIIDYTKRSGVVGAGSAFPGIQGDLGVSADYMHLYQAQLSENEDTNTLLKALENKMGQMNELARNYWMPIEEQIGNAMSLIVGLFPFGEYFNIENAFYLASVASFALEALEWKKTNSTLKQIAMNTGGIYGGKDSGIFGKFTTFLSSHAKTIGWLSIIAGTVMGIADGVKATNNPDDYGNKNTTGGKVKSFVDGFIFGDAKGSGKNALGNGAKWAAIGAGVGLLIGGPPGALIGGIIGLIGGGALGAAGGNNAFTNMTSDLFGVSNTIGSKSSKEEAKGGPSLLGNIGGIESSGNSSSSWPWKVTSPFGVTRSYTNTKGERKKDVHRGIDLSKANAEGTPMGVNIAGVVSGSGTASDGANYVKIKDDSGYTHLYWHLQQKSPLTVGQRVNSGQFLGLMGSTGNVTGPHLHYGIVDPSGTYINPHSFITQGLFNVSNEATTTSTSKVESPNEIINPNHKLISANTTQVDAVRAAYENNYGSDAIVSSVNTGFGNLINKLDELSKRQDATEDILRNISSSSSDVVYRY